MTLKAYLDNIKAKTGMTPEDFKMLAKKKGLLEEGVKTGQIVSWLKQDFGLGHGHAMAIVLMLKSNDQPKMSTDEKVGTIFAGDKAKWRTPFDDMMLKIREFGTDISLAPTNTYISLLRKGKKFAIVAATSDRLDIGIKLKGAKPTKRFEASGDWNAMVTHRVKITDPEEIDTDVLDWLKQAYENAPARQTIPA